jgi:hypothetical protein
MAQGNDFKGLLRKRAQRGAAEQGAEDQPD